MTTDATPVPEQVARAIKCLLEMAGQNQTLKHDLVRYFQSVSQYRLTYSTREARRSESAEIWLDQLDETLEGLKASYHLDPEQQDRLVKLLGAAVGHDAQATLLALQPLVRQDLVPVQPDPLGNLSTTF